MTDKEFNKIIAAISQYYPNNFEIDKLGLDLWKLQLIGLDANLVFENLLRYVADHHFPPAVADLRGSNAQKLLPYQEKNEEFFIQLEEWKREAAANPTPPEKIAEMKARLFEK